MSDSTGQTQPQSRPRGVGRLLLEAGAQPDPDTVAAPPSVQSVLAGARDTLSYDDADRLAGHGMRTAPALLHQRVLIS